MLEFFALILAVFLIILPSYGASTPSDRDVNTTLARIINQLDAILPLIEQGQEEQARLPQKAIQFHFTGFTTHGHYHSGLKEDILAMREGIVEAIEQTPIAAQAIEPLSLNYRDDPVKEPHGDEKNQSEQ